MKMHHLEEGEVKEIMEKVQAAVKEKNSPPIKSKKYSNYLKLHQKVF